MCLNESTENQLTREELNGLMAETAETLRGLGIPVSRKIQPEVLVNTRARRRLGCCRYQNGVYAIEVSASLLGRPETLRQTLAHELLHTCPGCRNHGDRWKAYAEKVNQALGLQIQRLAPAGEEEQIPLRRDTVKYVLECEACGARFPRTRMCKLVRTPWRYRCRCGGRLKRVL